MLDARETSILGHALAAARGPEAEDLARRLSVAGAGGPSLDARDRETAALALETYASTHQSFGSLACSLARDLRTLR